MALIHAQDAAFAYEGNTVIEELNFSVNAGDYLCIVGENGSGKSTLMKGMLGLKNTSAGTVLLGDGLHPTEIGFLPQQTAAQKDFPASVYEVVLSGRLNSRGLLPFYSSHDKDIASENIEKLGITHLRNRCYRELSGGQQQRVLLARALCATSRMLLLDEPVSGLDPLVTAELYELIGRINRETGITVVMVSHDVQSAVENASHILHLHGRQLFFGRAADYRESDTAKRFLEGERHV